MKLTTKKLKQIIKEELNEYFFQFNQNPPEKPTPKSRFKADVQWNKLGKLPSQLDFSYENPDSW